jgi:hypothetical protein
MKTLTHLYRDIADAKTALTSHHAEHSLWLAKAEVLAQNIAKAESALDEAYVRDSAANKVPV